MRSVFHDGAWWYLYVEYDMLMMLIELQGTRALDGQRPVTEATRRTRRVVISRQQKCSAQWFPVRHEREAIGFVDFEKSASICVQLCCAFVSVACGIFVVVVSFYGYIPRFDAAAACGKTPSSFVTPLKRNNADALLSFPNEHGTLRTVFCLGISVLECISNRYLYMVLEQEINHYRPGVQTQCFEGANILCP